ncbi:MAG TPA: hypothetical protein ENK18_04795 [Deltaproteobacteria bacterium]|nr:hypothetical protein [Deltaproteobacteria bacterium]
MLSLILLSCSGDPVTSETTLAGRLLDPQGQPVEGVLVQSLEGQARTRADGRFSVEIKPPSRLAHFTVAGIWYRRRVLPGEDGHVLELQLPPTRAAELRCPPVDCELQLTWPLAPGFEAQLRPGCSPGASVGLPAAPAAIPEVSCTVGRGASAHPAPVQVTDQGNLLIINEQGTPVRVEVRAIDGALPDDCRVWIGRRIASSAGEGAWVAEATGPVTVGAVCAGAMALPRYVDPASQGDGVVLEWVANGPSLDLEELAPWAEEVVIAAEDAGWSTPVALRDGAVHLPPLPAGRYRVLIRDAEQDLPLLAEPPTGRSGVLTVSAPSEGTLVGRLELEADLEGGTIQVVSSP